MLIIGFSFCLFLTTGIFYNQPKFSPCATWNPIGVTFPTNSTIVSWPVGIFVDTENSVYVTSRYKDILSIWRNDTTIVPQEISPNMQDVVDVFVTADGYLYVSSAVDHPTRLKLSPNSSNNETLMMDFEACYNIFIDVNDFFYCSMKDYYRIVSQPLDNSSKPLSIVAGNGTGGADSTLLNQPRGIFVDDRLNLYVADKNNNRIQRFAYGQLNATTVAGRGASGIAGNISLNQPTDIILDADDNLFIVDSKNHRIVRLAPNEFQCLAGCSRSSGSASDQLNKPKSLSFDSYGNIFVTDRVNERIQKFLLATNSCGKFTQKFYHYYYQPYDCT